MYRSVVHFALEDLCHSSNLGGQNLLNLEHFSKALLAKQTTVFLYKNNLWSIHRRFKYHSNRCPSKKFLPLGRLSLISWFLPLSTFIGPLEMERPLKFVSILGFCLRHYFVILVFSVAHCFLFNLKWRLGFKQKKLAP